MKTESSILLSLTFGCCLIGCSAVNEVHDITDVKAGGAITGIPFRLADNYRVRVFRLQPDGSYEEVYKELRAMPNQERIFAANFKADALSDHAFKVELNPDNTLKTTSIKTTQKITEAANALADEVVANRTAREERATAAKTSATSQRTLEATAIELEGKANVAEAQLAAALKNPDSTEVDRVTAETAVTLAKKKANDAAVEAGRPLPFP